MTLEAAEFIRRFLIHVLPKGFHRIRHYGLLASGSREENLAQVRELLQVAASTATDPEDEGGADDREPQAVLAARAPAAAAA